MKYRKRQHSRGGAILCRTDCIDGKCGAVLAAEKLIREMNVGDEAEFDDKFSETYGSLKCGELVKAHGRRCNELVGFAADYVEERLP